MREKTVCFSGHRPEKLPGKGESSDRRTKIIKSLLYFKIFKAVEDGYEYFISGLARGVDLWVAMIVLELKTRYPQVKLVGVKPNAGHGSNFSGEDKYMLNYILSRADEVVCTSEEYCYSCYRIRNEYMVDRASRLIAVLNNYASGTGQTVKYARKKGLETEIIDTVEIEAIYKAYYNTNPDEFQQDFNT